MRRVTPILIFLFVCGVVTLLALWRITPSSAGRSAKKSYERGRAHFEAREYDLAVEDFSEAIQLDPTHAEARHYRGWAYEMKGDYDRAIDDYSAAIRLKPDYSDAYNGRGIAHYEKRDYERAIADHSEAIRLDPRYAERLQQPRAGLPGERGA